MAANDEIAAGAMAAARHSSDPEVRASALSRTYSCYYETRQYDMAMHVLDSLFTLNADTFTYTIRKADILQARGDVPQALAVLDSAIQDTAHLEYRPAYCSAYEEMAVPYIKGLIEEGATRRAFDALRNAPLPMPHQAASHGFGTGLMPDYYPRPAARPVSCYALFE